MVSLDNVTKFKLESILGMLGGYVLDFGNAQFADFIKTAVGFNPYDKYGEGSKAVLLRKIWKGEIDAVVAKLNSDLLGRWRVGKLLMNVQPTEAEQTLHDELKKRFSNSTAPTRRPKR